MEVDMDTDLLKDALKQILANQASIMVGDGFSHNSVAVRNTEKLMEELEK